MYDNIPVVECKDGFQIPKEGRIIVYYPEEEMRVHFLDGEVHNEFGPAIEGTKEPQYYLNGSYYNEIELWNKEREPFLKNSIKNLII